LQRDSPDKRIDFSEFDRLVVHRKLQTFEVTAHIVSIGGMRSVSQPCVENLDVVVANFVTEPESVGKVLVPGGLLV
jgi:hypothetical protein